MNAKQKKFARSFLRELVVVKPRDAVIGEIMTEGGISIRQIGGQVTTISYPPPTNYSQAISSGLNYYFDEPSA